jgi:hypothetical protein
MVKGILHEDISWKKEVKTNQRLFTSSQICWKTPIKEVPIDPDNELQFIELLDEYVIEADKKKRLCKIGSATTNEQFREWIVGNSLDEGNDTWKSWWTLPLNVIMVEITFGGSNGPVCHRAGKHSTTLSDLSTSIEFVNCNGELQTINDSVQLKSVSDCFRMMGIVTSNTMKLDPLTFAQMVPEKKHVALSILPPVVFDVPRKFRLFASCFMMGNQSTQCRIMKDYYCTPVLIGQKNGRVSKCTMCQSKTICKKKLAKIRLNYFVLVL